MAPAAVEFSKASSNSGLVGLMIENIMTKNVIKIVMASA